MIGFKASTGFKEFLQQMAKRENRSLSNFIVNALITYAREKHGVEWKEESEEQEPKKKPKK